MWAQDRSPYSEESSEVTRSTSPDIPTTRLRKRARISYFVPSESDVESDAGSGYDSDASLEWGSRATKQPKAKRARKEKAVKPFPFLSLPTELRNKIYSMALEDPNGMVLREGWRSHHRVAIRGWLNRWDFYDAEGYSERYSGQLNVNLEGTFLHARPDHWATLSPALLAVNKQIHAEAKAMLYAQPLHFATTTALHNFLAPLSDTTCSLIRSITLHSYENRGTGVRKAMKVSALTLLRNCKNLRTMRVEESLSNGYSYCAPEEHHGGKDLAEQIYRDGAFWLDIIGADKALQVLDINGLDEQRGDMKYADRRRDDEFRKKMKAAFEVELRDLLRRRGGKPTKASKKKRNAVST